MRNWGIILSFELKGLGKQDFTFVIQAKAVPMADKPESSIFSKLQLLWTPVFTGVTTFYEIIN